METFDLNVFLDQIISFFANEHNRNFLFSFFKFFSLIGSVFLLGGLIFLFSKISAFRPEIDVYGAIYGAKKSKIGGAVKKDIVKEKWEKILEKIKNGTEENIKLAVIETDSLIDDLLKEKGVIGETMADRLKSIGRDELKTLDDLWEAHKLRNKIAHQPHFKIDYIEAKQAFKNYKAALKELGGL